MNTISLQDIDEFVISVARPMCKPCYDLTDKLLFDEGIDRMMYK